MKQIAFVVLRFRDYLSSIQTRRYEISSTYSVMGKRLDVYETANDYNELWDDRWRKMEACQYVTAPLRVYMPVELVADCQVGV